MTTSVGANGLVPEQNAGGAPKRVGSARRARGSKWLKGSGKPLAVRYSKN